MPEPPPESLTIVLPSYNEAGRLPATLASLAECSPIVDGFDEVMVLVVDDGSSDSTAQAAASHPAAGRLGLRVLEHERNRGKGAAVRTGFAAASGGLVLLADADAATPFGEIERLLPPARDGALAVGSRAVDRSLILHRQPAYRDLMGRVFNLAVRVLAVPGVRDTQCGFKVYPGPLARRLAAVQTVDGFAFDVEHLLLARTWGWPVVELPVRWRHVEESRVQAGRHSADMLRSVIALWWRTRRRALPIQPELP
jgi:dolichyl-phosphate beta-glucosyltransferase